MHVLVHDGAVQRAQRRDGYTSILARLSALYDDRGKPGSGNWSELAPGWPRYMFVLCLFAVRREAMGI